MNFDELVQQEYAALEESAMPLAQRNVVSDLKKAGWDIEKRTDNAVVCSDGKHSVSIDAQGNTKVIKEGAEQDITKLIESESADDLSTILDTLGE